MESSSVGAPLNTLDVAFKLVSGTHYLMSAAKAAELEIHSDAQDKPTLFSAGMSFLHGEYIADADVHS